MDINTLKELSGYSSDPETICLRISGDDAGKFLQGQFSNDINLLEKDISQYSSYSTNQGKVIAILRKKTHDPEKSPKNHFLAEIQKKTVF